MIITVTLDAALERTIYVSGFKPGKRCKADASRMDPGGRGLEAAAAVCSLGGQCAALGVVGGAAGEYIRDRLDAQGIHNDLIFSRTETRSNLRIVDTESGETTWIEGQGAPVTAQELQEVWQKLRDLADPGDAVLFTGDLPMPPEQLAQWIMRLRQDGVLVALEAGGLAMKVGAAAGPSLVVADPAALSELCERPLRTRDELLAGARRVAVNGVSYVTVPLGADGALFVSKEAALQVSGLTPCGQGAGPAMVASILVDLERGAPWEQTAVWALAASASEAQPPAPEDLPPLLNEVDVEWLP